MKKFVRKVVWSIAGCLCLAIGLIGLVVPFLPGFVFFMLAVVCFSSSSDKLRNRIQRSAKFSSLKQKLPDFDQLELKFWQGLRFLTPKS